MGAGIEGLNPTRRYKWFRPRQAARGYLALATTVNFPNVGLWNSSEGNYYLIVRQVNFGIGINGSDGGIYYVQGQPGTLGGTVQMMMPGVSALPGKLWSLDNATAPTFDQRMSGIAIGSITTFTWNHDYPVAVLPPSWSLVTAYNAVANLLRTSFLWEAIMPEELDYMYE